MNLWMRLGVEDIHEPLEVACRSLGGCSLCKVLGQLGVKRVAKTRAIHFTTEATEKAS